MKKKKSILKAMLNKETEVEKTGKTITGGTKYVKKSNKGGEKVKEVNKTQKTLSGGSKQISKSIKGGKVKKEVIKRDTDGNIVKKRKVNRKTLGSVVKGALAKAKAKKDIYSAKPKSAKEVATETIDRMNVGAVGGTAMGKGPKQMSEAEYDAYRKKQMKEKKNKD